LNNGIPTVAASQPPELRRLRRSSGHALLVSDWFNDLFTHRFRWGTLQVSLGSICASLCFCGPFDKFDGLGHSAELVAVNVVMASSVT
jgi:hypothetical protein